MIHPDDILRAAEKCYPKVLRAWVDGDDALFPYVVRGSRDPDREDFAAAAAAVRLLRERSKQARGFGYTVEWREVNSRHFGRNAFPARIVFESREDLLRLIGKQAEFDAFAAAAGMLRSEFPALAGWVRSHPERLVGAVESLEGLLHVLRYFRAHPRPNRFARELPVPVDTKFVERHQTILRQWFDLILPSHAIRADEKHFERRYGLRYATDHVGVRLLDPALASELSFPCEELSLPLAGLAGLAGLPARGVRVFVVENRVNLFTFPPVNRGIAIEGRGYAAAELRRVRWLADAPMTYWGDLDIDGFRILSNLRAIFSQTRSLLMDGETFGRWRDLAVAGTGASPALPSHLTDAERDAFERCRSDNLRLEQERIPQAFVTEAVTSLSMLTP